MMRRPDEMSHEELLAAFYSLQAENERQKQEAEAAFELAATAEAEKQADKARIAELEAQLKQTEEASAPCNGHDKLEKAAKIATRRTEQLRELLAVERRDNARLQHRISSHRCVIPNLRHIESYSCGCVWVVDTRTCDGSLDLEFDTELIPTCIHELPPERHVKQQAAQSKQSAYTLVSATKGH